MNTDYMKGRISSFLTNNLEESGQDCFVVGVSGGVDSGVVAKMCADTGKPTVLAQLPSYGYSQADYRADHFTETLSKRDHVTRFEMDIGPASQHIGLSIQAKGQDFEFHDLEDANLQCRLRMCVLYALSNINDGLVVGTDNAVESYLGFFTKGGDGVFDINPLGDLLKTEIWELARDINVPNEIVEATPTDGLWPDDRSDEYQIGATYEEVERIMMGDPEGIDDGVVDQVVELHEANQHKTSETPTCEFQTEDIYE